MGSPRTCEVWLALRGTLLLFLAMLLLASATACGEAPDSSEPAESGRSGAEPAEPGPTPSTAAPSDAARSEPSPSGASDSGASDAESPARLSRASVSSDAAGDPRPPRIGLWVLAEGEHRTLEDPARVTRLIREAKRLGATDLLVQVHRQGKSWFPSEHADDSPYRAIREATGEDTLARLIREAHAQQLKVHAWFNVLCLADNRSAPLLESVGPQAVLVDRRGRSLLDYPAGEVPAEDLDQVRMGTPGIWLDPAVPGVVDFLVATRDDLVRGYPELDGLHLDFIRHPMALPLVPGSRFDVGLDFGYGDASKRAFEERRGQAFERGNDWDEFRRDAVTETVRRLGAELPERFELSAAVIAYADRAYLTAMQDWRRWIDEGLLDFAVAMAYTRDDRMLRYMGGSLVGGIAGDRVWLGLGTWLFAREPEGALRQLDIARAQSPAGIVYFSYDAIADRADALEALRPQP